VALRRAEREGWLRVLPQPAIGAGAVSINPFLDRFFGPMKDEPDVDGVLGVVRIDG
jgi:hypothetical protein